MKTDPTKIPWIFFLPLIFTYNFFPYMWKCYLDIVKQTKESFQKKLVKGINIFLNERKIKSINKLANDIEIFQKERKIKSKNMAPQTI